MKLKIVLLVLSAIVLLSFTFVSVQVNRKAKAVHTLTDRSIEPVGGFIITDKI